ncbi:MAG: hypothetical protein WD066_01435 [Planctomycetaceae bacterium]
MTAEPWNLDPPPGFQGLRPDLPVTVYHRHLPHWRQEGATYFVTIRLADSLPQAKLRELEAWKREWLARQGIRGTDCRSPLRADVPPDKWEEYAREIVQKVDRWLDQGMGACPFKCSEARDIVLDTIRRFDGKRYELGCCVGMPNHVHVVVRPFDPRESPLEKILQSWKLWTARKVNALLRRDGTLWQQEAFDRIVRDAEHLWRCIQYIARNPRYAGLSPEHFSLWINPAWERCGWRFEPT